MKNVQKHLLDLAILSAPQTGGAMSGAAAAATLIADMVAAGQKTAALTLPNGDEVKGTLVTPQTVAIDEARLKAALGSKMWPKVTKAVLDKDALEAQVAVGNIDANVVAGCSTLKDIKASVRVSGTYSAEEAVEVAKTVSIRDAKGRVKPAAKRIIKS